MRDFKRIMRLGCIILGRQRADVFCAVKFKDGKLSFTGVEGPKANGDCRGASGQIEMHLTSESFADFAPGWSRMRVMLFLQDWKDWHLNDMQAGSPRQMAFICSLPEDRRDYEAACEELRTAGLLEDERHVIDGKPYRYGTKWLTREVPSDVLERLASLPDADKPCPWSSL